MTFYYADIAKNINTVFSLNQNELKQYTKSIDIAIEQSVPLFNQSQSHSIFWRGIANRLTHGRQVARGAFDVVPIVRDVVPIVRLT
ncbi:MAG: hypothetical protein LBJ67_05245 [Planctomycetaceae bacterium]|nr:hypothetical protein [Planctomycetaceae bacterium]